MGSSTSKTATVPIKTEEKTNPKLTTEAKPQSQVPALEYKSVPQLDWRPQAEFICSQCGLKLPSDEALFKHKLNSCPASIKHQNGSTHREIFMNDGNSSYRSSLERKRDELTEWKHQRSLLQSVQDIEDRIQRDSQKTRKLAENLKQRTESYKAVLVEYEDLQAQERRLIREMFDIQNQTSPSQLSTEQYELQTRQLEDLERRIARLEVERGVIQSKLEKMIMDSHEPEVISNYDPYILLRRMREQQDSNDKALTYLTRRLAYRRSARTIMSDIPTLPPIDSTSARSQRTLFDRTKSPILSSYDPIALLRASDVERRLREYEYYPWHKSLPTPLTHYRYALPEPPKSKVDDVIISTMQENIRLKNDYDQVQSEVEHLQSRTKLLEMALLKNGYLDSPKNHNPDLSSTRPKSPPKVVRPSHQNEILRKPPSPSYRVIEHQRQNPPVINQNTEIDPSLALQSSQFYDPIAGFVLFYDFVINLPAEIRRCQLISSLHHPQSGLGVPCQLQPFFCDYYLHPKTSERFSYANIAVKQPVPGCPPQQDITVVLEFQSTVGTNIAEVFQFTSWTKIPLFDQRNRLITGRWKIPLLNLPIQQDINFHFIRNISRFGQAELCYRLVNARNASEQKAVTFSPSIPDLYLYPTQFVN